jgi:hypothetical protein
VGWITCEGRPIAICGWACKIPSSSHKMPKPVRNSSRQAGSATAGPGARASVPVPLPAAGSHARTLTQARPSVPKMSSAMSP